GAGAGAEAEAEVEVEVKANAGARAETGVKIGAWQLTSPAPDITPPTSRRLNRRCPANPVPGPRPRDITRLRDPDAPTLNPQPPRAPATQPRNPATPSGFDRGVTPLPFILVGR
ncbi:hypothetical protein TH8_21585, partial [Thalassospira profundimaris]